ncbi:MAG: ATP-binding protein, partial [Fidelibacterota bacterium]
PGFSTKKRGWGLGLSLTRRIIEDIHKGKIILVSSKPGGTIFRIDLPKNNDFST